MSFSVELTPSTETKMSLSNSHGQQRQRCLCRTCTVSRGKDVFVELTRSTETKVSLSNLNCQQRLLIQWNLSSPVSKTKACVCVCIIINYVVIYTAYLASSISAVYNFLRKIPVHSVSKNKTFDIHGTFLACFERAVERSFDAGLRRFYTPTSGPVAEQKHCGKFSTDQEDVCLRKTWAGRVLK